MVYENVQIGNFLIGLGYALRDLNRKLYGSINLYQQTPKDQESGDAFGVLNERYFILEFKRDKANIVNEQRKMASQLLARYFEHQPDDSLRNISWHSHLMLFPSWKNEELNYDVLPYLLALQQDNEQNPLSHITSSADFVNEMFSNNCIIGCSITEMEGYLQLLQRCLPDKSENATGRAARRRGSFAGLIFCVDPAEKKMQSMQFQNLEELAQNLKYRLSIHLGLQQQKEQVQEQATRISMQQKTRGENNEIRMS